MNAQLVMQEADSESTPVDSKKSENINGVEKLHIKWSNENQVQEAEDQNQDTVSKHRQIFKGKGVLKKQTKVAATADAASAESKVAANPTTITIEEEKKNESLSPEVIVVETVKTQNKEKVVDVLDRSIKDDKKPIGSSNSANQNLQSINSTIDVQSWNSLETSGLIS